MKKAFIFDLDGVIIDDETIWEEAKQEIYPQIFGQKVYEKLGSTIGINMDGIYEKAATLGTTVSKERLFEELYNAAQRIYQTAPLTPNIEKLLDLLLAHNYRMGIVSSSPKAWIGVAINRLPQKNYFSSIISTIDRKDIERKPAPDGYLAAMKELDTKPESAIILEDSNLGIAAAKAAGAYTIGLKENLVKGQKQEGADMYADTIDDVIKFVLAKQ
jgi:mannitol-1-/sugar-/sorbitol-6-/2-deoxyglucose-6-phosphatase